MHGLPDILSGWLFTSVVHCKLRKIGIVGNINIESLVGLVKKRVSLRD